MNRNRAGRVGAGVTLTLLLIVALSYQRY